MSEGWGSRGVFLAVCSVVVLLLAAVIEVVGAYNLALLFIAHVNPLAILWFVWGSVLGVAVLTFVYFGVVRGSSFWVRDAVNELNFFLSALMSPKFYKSILRKAAIVILLMSFLVGSVASYRWISSGLTKIRTYDDLARSVQAKLGEDYESRVTELSDKLQAALDELASKNQVIQVLADRVKELEEANKELQAATKVKLAKDGRGNS